MADNFSCFAISLALDISLLELLFKSFLLDYMVLCYKRLLQVLEDMAINFYLVTRPAAAPQVSSGCYLLQPTLFLWGLLAFGKLALKTQKKRQLLPPWLVILKEKKQEAIYRFFWARILWYPDSQLVGFLLLLVSWSIQVFRELRANMKGCCITRLPLLRYIPSASHYRFLFWLWGKGGSQSLSLSQDPKVPYP